MGKLYIGAAIIIIIALCGAYWLGQQRVNAEAIRLEKIRLEQTYNAQMIAKDEMIAAHAKNIDDLQSKYTLLLNKLKAKAAEKEIVQTPKTKQEIIERFIRLGYAPYEKI